LSLLPLLEESDDLCTFGLAEVAFFFGKDRRFLDHKILTVLLGGCVGIKAGIQMRMKMTYVLRRLFRLKMAFTFCIEMTTFLYDDNDDIFALALSFLR
jgi:hypothetical protein